jgi:hypothetical protein
MITTTNTVIVGGGQAGLSVSYFLKSCAWTIWFSNRRICRATLGVVIAGIPSP